MNKKELHIRLRKEGVPDNYYVLDGRPQGGKLMLEKIINNWTVYFQSERGEIFEKRDFLSEEDACEYFYQRVTSVNKYHEKSNYLG